VRSPARLPKRSTKGKKKAEKRDKLDYSGCVTNLDRMKVRFQHSMNTHHPELLTAYDEEALKAAKSLKDVHESLNRGKALPHADPPEDLLLTLLPFQRESLHWLREQEKTEFRGGIL
jgi:SNF2 family DNA or RNA helicase